MSQSTRHYLVTAILTFVAAVFIITSTPGAEFVFDYALAFFLFGTLHRAIEEELF